MTNPTNKENNNTPQIFNFDKHEIRTTTQDGQIWFVANDIAEALEYTNPREALKKHVDGEDVTKRDMLTRTGNKKTNCISESGMYSLILSSKKSEAKKFKRWVTSEVLPQIRQTGRCMKQRLNDNRVSFVNLLVLAKKMPPLIQCTVLMIGLKGPVARAWVINPLFADRLAKGTFNYKQLQMKLSRVILWN